MRNLVSVLNSGESIEKAAILSRLGNSNNSSFYSNFDTTYSFYYDNLPKQSKDIYAHGTLGAIVQNLKVSGYIPYNKIEDLWDDRIHILDVLTTKHIISERIKERLQLNKVQFDSIVPHLSWHLLFDVFKTFLTKEFLDTSSFSLEYIDFKKVTKVLFQISPSLSYHSRLFLLHPSGIINSKQIWKSQNSPNYYKLKQIDRSISLSPNVYLFLITVCETIDSFKDCSIGYRKFQNTKRASYDAGLAYIFKSKINLCIEEPKNTLFNKLLDQIDEKYMFLTAEEKTNMAIYDYLNQTL